MLASEASRHFDGRDWSAIGSAEPTVDINPSARFAIYVPHSAAGSTTSTFRSLRVRPPDLRYSSTNGAHGLAANTTTVLPRRSATLPTEESLSTRTHRSVLR